MAVKSAAMMRLTMITLVTRLSQEEAKRLLAKFK